MTIMSKRQALTLAALALEAEAAKDPGTFTEWYEAAAVIRAMLAEERGTGNGADRPPGAWSEVKTINGRQYLYWRWRADGKLKSQYVEPVREN